MNKVAIIPARGGSKRIPRKNINFFLGKPIIAYSIEAALESGLFDEVMISTDDEEIASIAKQYGATVPFLRSKKNADDFATTFDVIEEVVLSYKKIDVEFQYACCIYPCAPFVNKNILNKSFELLEESLADSCLPIVKYSSPIQRALKINVNKLLEYQNPSFINTRSQDLEPSYFDAGQFYWLRINAILNERKIIGKNSVSIIFDENKVQDIDNEVDWQIAELKYKLINNEPI